MKGEVREDECARAKENSIEIPVGTDDDAIVSGKKKTRAIVDDEFKEGDKISIRLIPTADNDDLMTPYPNHQEFLDRSNIRT